MTRHAVDGVLPSLRWGIAGYGDVVRRRALPALAALGQPVMAIWGRNRIRAEALAAGAGAGLGTDNFATLLDAVDAVYIATPVSAHVPLSAEALLAGRHVLVEKPLGGSLPYDLPYLQQLAETAGTVASVAYYRRYSPATRFLCQLFAAEECQQIRLRFRSAFAPRSDDPKVWRTDVTVAGGGVLADAGSHRIDLLCKLFGPPSHVAGELDGFFPAGAERRALLKLGWPGGCQAQALLEWSPGPPRDDLTFTSHRLTVECPDLDSGLLRVTSRAIASDYHLPPEPNPVTAAFRDLIECASSDRSPECSLMDGAIVDEVIRSAISANLSSGSARSLRPPVLPPRSA